MHLHFVFFLYSKLLSKYLHYCTLESANSSVFIAFGLVSSFWFLLVFAWILDSIRRNSSDCAEHREEAAVFFFSFIYTLIHTWVLFYNIKVMPCKCSIKLYVIESRQVVCSCWHPIMMLLLFLVSCIWLELILVLGVGLLRILQNLQ